MSLFWWISFGMLGMLVVTVYGHLAGQWQTSPREPRIEVPPDLSMADPQTLVRTALQTKDGWVLRDAIKYLDDADLLRQLATEAPAWVRAAATSEVVAQDVLSKIVTSDVEPAVRQSAVRNIKDKTLLRQLAVADSDAYVRQLAAVGCEDDTLWAEMAATEPDAYVRQMATDVLLGKKDKAAAGEREAALDVDALVDELIAIYVAHPDGFVKRPTASIPASLNGPSAGRVKEIGEQINGAGGKRLMLFAHAQFDARSCVRASARNLEQMWDGVGEWRG